MRCGTAVVTLCDMSTRRRRTLTLELEGQPADAIAGRVVNEAGNGIEFTGWLGFAGALETALEGAPVAGDTGSNAEEGGGRDGDLYLTGGPATEERACR